MFLNQVYTKLFQLIRHFNLTYLFQIETAICLYYKITFF